MFYSLFLLQVAFVLYPLAICGLARRVRKVHWPILTPILVHSSHACRKVLIGRFFLGGKYNCLHTNRWPFYSPPSLSLLVVSPWPHLDTFTSTCMVMFTHSGQQNHNSVHAAVMSMGISGLPQGGRRPGHFELQHEKLPANLQGILYSCNVLNMWLHDHWYPVFLIHGTLLAFSTEVIHAVVQRGEFKGWKRTRNHFTY